MSALRVACVLAFVAPAFAADPPKPAKPAVEDLYVLHAPGGWMLDIRSDGSGHLQFGSTFGDGCRVPAGTFKPADVRKALDGVKLDPKGGRPSHFVIWYEAERKAPDDGPPARYTRDEKVVVPLFEKAAEAGKLKDSARGKELLEKKPFGLRAR